KQGFGRGVMKINIVAVRENKLYPAQRIVVARFLADNGKPVAKAELFHVFFSQIVRILLHGWENLRTHDASGNIPIGTENDVLYLICKDHRLTAGLADDNVH